ncbi:MAG: hypothetical protein WAT79_16905 [Saprospiraceae bacterium]
MITCSYKGKKYFGIKIPVCILTIAFILFTFSINSSAQCDRQRDSLALVNLFLTTKGIDWAKNTNWNVPNSPINTWYGVMLNAQGCVAELNLNSNRLEGPIPDDIVHLRQITKLLLNDNRLTIGNNTDSLPKGWSFMQNLEVLNLSSNILGGPVIVELGSLTNLKILNLSLNYFKNSLPSSLGNLQNLKQLLLNQNEISGVIPSTFGQLSNIEEIILSKNQLSGILPKELGNLTNLRVLSLSQNLLSGAIPSELGSINSLQFVYMNDNKFNGSIPTSIGNLSNIRELWLNQNELTGTIPNEIGMASKLVKLLLNNNQLTGNIPPILSGLVSLTALHLSFNHLDGQIPSGIGELVNLESFLLNDNSFTGAIPDNIGLLTKLANFQIQNNQFSGMLPESLGYLSSLKRIYFHNNNLVGCFPESYRSFCQLPLNLNTNANGHNFFGNTTLIFQGDFQQWCASSYRVNGDFITNAPLCEGNTLNLAAESQNLNYQWQGPNGFSSILSNPYIPNFSALLTGTYYLTVTDQNGCTGTSHQDIDIIGQGEIMVNSPLCEGKSIMFSISQGLSYEWSGPNNFMSIERNPTIPNANKMMEGIYKVKIITVDCTIEKEIEVILTTIGEVSQIEPVCLESDALLMASGGSSYRWTGPANFTSTNATPTISNVNQNKTGIYHVEISDNTGCKSSYQVALDIVEPSIPDIKSLDSICQEADPVLLPTIQGIYSGYWQGEGVIEKDNLYFYDPKGKQGFQEILFIPNPSIFSCVKEGIGQIFVHFVDVRGEEITPNTSEDNDNAIFSITSSGTGTGSDMTVEWSGASEGIKTIRSNTTFEVDGVPSGLYTLRVENDAGCVALDTFFVRNYFSNFSIPNVISKSSSNSENSIFTVYGENIYAYSMDIYDRWGNLHFQEENLSPNVIEEGFDVGHKNIQSGVYVVILTLYLPKGIEKSIHSLTIID